MKVRIWLMLLIGGLGMLLATTFIAYAARPSIHPYAPEDGNNIFLPMLARNASPDIPTRIELTVSTHLLTAGFPIHLEAVTLNSYGNPVYDSFFDVFVEVKGRSEDSLQRITLSAHGDGVYSGLYTPTASGGYTFSAFVDDGEAADKWPPTDQANVQVVAGPLETIEMVSGAPFGAAAIRGWDTYHNPVPQLPPTGFECLSSNPDLMPMPPMPDPRSPEYQLLINVIASDYLTATLSCIHSISGAAASLSIGYAPWELEMHDAHNQYGSGFRVDSFFDVFYEIRLPAGETGWRAAFGELQFPKEAGVLFNGCQALTPDFNVLCTLDEDHPLLNTISFTLTNSLPSGVIGEITPFKLNFLTPAGTDDIILAQLVVSDYRLVDTAMVEITYPNFFLLDPWWSWYPFAVKPTKQLNMHIYLVEGSATITDVNADVEMAEAGFNINALLCTCGFYIDFVPQITVIPKTDWKKIDTDGDGLDRYDRNGDGDYADPGDNNDLFEAMVLDYFDVSPNTENIYYVPGIRGGALGTTYSPNGQVAVDNSKDGDNLTLLHEKIHEMDYRKDGDFDVNDSPDDAGNAQGARTPGNIMNYDKTGPFLTKSQCDELDP